MIQLTYSKGALFTFNNYINLFDEYNGLASYKPLITFTSQLTGKSKTFIPTVVDYTNKDRYVLLTYYLTTTLGDNLTAGIIELGDTDYPLGFYDVVIYENSSNTNLDPSGLNVVYNGLMNLSSTTAPSVTYSEYTTNDTDTESVYITF